MSLTNALSFHSHLLLHRYIKNKLLSTFIPLPSNLSVLYWYLPVLLSQTKGVSLVFKVNTLTLDSTSSCHTSIFNVFPDIHVCKCFPYFKKKFSPSQATLLFPFISFLSLPPYLHPQSPHSVFWLFYFTGASFKKLPGIFWFPDLKASLHYSYPFIYIELTTLTTWNLKLLVPVHHTLVFLLRPLTVAFHSSSSAICAENDSISLGSRLVLLFFLHIHFQDDTNNIPVTPSNLYLQP